MSIWQALLLSIVQGVTEFIPVSSSGHLVLVQHFLGLALTDDIFFEILTHAGTSVAIVLVYFKDLWRLADDCLFGEGAVRRQAWRYVGYIVVGSIPVALVGLFLMAPVVATFARPGLAAAMLLITATFLLLTKNHSGKGLEIGLMAALLIGLAQAFAPLPGISRSGITISTALLFGISRDEAGRFSFMLALPALLGAAFLDFRKIESLTDLPLSPAAIAVSFLVSATVGFFALKLLLNFVHRGQLHYFGYYCAGAGLLSLLLICFFGV